MACKLRTKIVHPYSMRYLLAIAVLLLIAACGKDPKQHLKGKWLVRSASLHGQQQQLPDGAFMEFDNEKMIVGEADEINIPEAYELRGDTIARNDTLNGMPRNRYMIIEANDGKNMRLKELDLDAIIELEKETK